MQLSFLLFNKFKPKKLGGAVGTSLIVNICRRQRSSTFACIVTIPSMNKLLVPEWPCIIEVSYISSSYSPNFYIHVSVSDLYIPRIPLIFLQQNRQTNRENI
jgi:hypothetical protein